MQPLLPTYSPTSIPTIPTTPTTPPSRLPFGPLTPTPAHRTHAAGNADPRTTSALVSSPLYIVVLATVSHCLLSTHEGIITGASGPFLTTTTPTTYRVLLSPYTAHLRYTVPSLLSLNHQIHAEAAKVLYSNYTFRFHTSIEAAVPFFSDLTPIARDAVRNIGLTKKGLPYTKEFDRLEWAALCTYMSSSLRLCSLDLTVIAGRPGENGWDNVAPISKEAFGLMQRMRKDWGSSVGGADLTWVEQLFELKGLRQINIKALVEHCPGPVSEIMAFWIAFSKSVEDGFSEWVRDVMT